MTIRRVFIFLIVIAAVSLRVEMRADHDNGLPDHKGTDFYVAFPQNISGSGLTNSVPALSISVSVETATTVQVTAPGFATLTVDVPDNTVQDFTLDEDRRPIFPGSTWQLTPNTKNPESKGIRIRSVVKNDPTQAGAEISVFVVNRRPGSTGGYLALPVDALGTTYMVAAWPSQTSAQGSQVTIIGTADHTTVTVTTRVNVPGVGTKTGVTFQILLNRFQTYLVQLQNDDLTGTVVTADKPVAVLGGTDAALIGVPSGPTDFIVEQMPPVPTWGREFIIPPVATRRGGDIIRVLAYEDGTAVTVNGAAAATLNAGAFHEFTQPSTVPAPAVPGSWIQASKPVLVAQYNKTGIADGVLTDAFMMLVPPVDQMSNRYLVRSAPTLTGTPPFINSLAIVAPVGTGAGIQRASNDDFSGPFSSTWTEIPGSGFEYAVINFPALPSAPVVHSIAHDSGDVPFGLFVYGRAFADGYGYAGGQLVADLNAPIVSVPKDVTAEATGPDGATVTWDAPTATDFGRGKLVDGFSCTAASGSVFALGKEIVECTATDPAGNTTTASFTVTVRDTTAPTLINMPRSIEVPATSPSGAIVTYAAPSASDVVDPDVVAACTPASGTTFSVGVHLVTCTAIDDSGNRVRDTFRVTVTNRPPTCSATPSIPFIWPPDHQMVSISVKGVIDPEGGSVAIRIDGIFQDEPVNDTGDGNAAVDGAGIGTSEAQVRAERSGAGNGRVYHVRYTATDSNGASCSGEITVGVVPHDQGRGLGGPHSDPVDGGALYDSTGL